MQTNKKIKKKREQEAIMIDVKVSDSGISLAMGGKTSEIAAEICIAIEATQAQMRKQKASEAEALLDMIRDFMNTWDFAAKPEDNFKKRAVEAKKEAEEALEELNHLVENLGDEVKKQSGTQISKVMCDEDDLK